MCMCAGKDPRKLVTPLHINYLKMNETISMKMELFNNSKAKQSKREGENELHAFFSHFFEIEMKSVHDR